MTDRPLYKELRRVFLDSWSDANGWASMLRMIAERLEHVALPKARRSARAVQRIREHLTA